MTSAARTQRMRVSRRELGLCPTCGGTPSPGRVYCGGHKRDNASARVAEYRRRRAAHECVDCRAPTDGVRARCTVHLAKRADGMDRRRFDEAAE